MNEQEFQDTLTNIFKFEMVKNNQLGFEFRYDELIFKLKKKRFREANLQLEKLTLDQGYELYSRKTYEVSLTENSSFIYNYREDGIEIEDNTNKLKYNLKSPSDSYLLMFLKELNGINEVGNQPARPVFFHRLRNRRFVEDQENFDLFDVLKYIIPRFKTLHIISDTDRSKSNFESLSLSFLFNLSYNTDLSYLPNNLIDDLNRTIRIGRIRRARIEEVDCPKRKYENNLILYYQKGISSESIDLKYLSFYHIIEHFFEKIYNDELTKIYKG